MDIRIDTRKLPSQEPQCVHTPYGKSWICHWEGGFELGTLLAVSFWGGRGVSNWAPYWQFHFGEGGGVPLQVDW